MADTSSIKVCPNELCHIYQVKGAKTEAKTIGQSVLHIFCFCFLNCWLLSLGETIWAALIATTLQLSMVQSFFPTYLKVVTENLCYPICLA